ncbi:MAG: NlpC/P60 family protein [Gaiellaceae bacterium]
MRRAVTSVLFLAALVAALLSSLSGGALANPIESKKAEAKRVLQEVNRINSELEQKINEFDHAQVQLGQIRRQLGQTKTQLVLTRKNLARAELMLHRRVVAVYTSGGQPSSLALVLGATSFSDLVNRIDDSQRVHQQDTHIVGQVSGLRDSLNKRVRTLRTAQATQQKVVAKREAERRYIEGQVSQVKAKLASIEAQLKQMRAAEAQHQAQLRLQAAQRLAAWRDQQRRQQLQAQSNPASSTSASDPSSASGDAATASSSTTPSPPSGPAPSSSVGSQVVSIAMQYLGVPYRWGGADPSGFDCSGLVMYVFSKVGISLPHYTVDQYNGGTPVSRDQLEPGDLVFFDGLGHVGIYIGGNQFIHAPQTGDVVKISELSGSYAAGYVGARRYG